MQGYIIDIKKVKDEDLIVSIITENELLTTYRFYGARHSQMNIGFKIDFEIENNYKSNISRLKDVIHLGYEWILDRQKLYYWQRFIKLFYPHLKDLEELDPFYKNLLDELSHKLTKQNSKRAILGTYLKLLAYEGRLQSSDSECFLCDEPIFDNFSLVRSFLPTHYKCSRSKRIDTFKVEELLDEQKLISFTDYECEYLWSLLMQGL